MSIDHVVVALIGLGTIVFIGHMRRRGARGRRWFAGGVVGMLGIVLVVSMSAHCVDVVGRLLAGTGHDGEPFAYDFRAYALLLLGLVLIRLGADLLRACLRLGRSEPSARAGALRATALVLFLVVPLIPLQRFFAIPLTVLSTTTLLVLAWLGVSVRAPAQEVNPSRAYSTSRA